MTVKACDSTINAPGRCDGWTVGWPWHGCCLPPNHHSAGGRGLHILHECKCGVRWDKRGRVKS